MDDRCLDVQILAGYWLPLILIGVWMLLGLWRFSYNQYKRLDFPLNDNNNREHKSTESRSLSAQTSGLQPLLRNNDAVVVDDSRTSRCSHSCLRVPSVQLILLYAALLSYSGIVKTTMSLLQVNLLLPLHFLTFFVVTPTHSSPFPV
jgi:hypothetical protein